MASEGVQLEAEKVWGLSLEDATHQRDSPPVSLGPILVRTEAKAILPTMNLDRDGKSSD